MGQAHRCTARRSWAENSPCTDSGADPKLCFPVRLAGRNATAAAEPWNRLASPAVGVRLFDPALVAGLPSAARRWLTHAIVPGAPSSPTAVLETDGQLRLGRWLPTQAVEVVSPPSGFVWAARVGWGLTSFRGFDRYEDSTGEMHWRLLGEVPLIHSRGNDIDRSAAGRLAGEAVRSPAAF
jgi:hypothetical protein